MREPFVGLISAEERARLLTQVGLRVLDAGEILIDAGGDLSQVFLIRSGELNVEGKQGGEQRNFGFVGEELALGATAYSARVVAAAASTVYVIPLRLLAQLAAGNGALKALLFDSYARSRHEASPAIAQPASKVETTERFGVQMIGWLVAIAGPLLVWELCTAFGLNTDAAYFLAIVSSAVAMWLFGLVPAFLPPLFSVLATILFDIAPAHIAMAGFASNGFFMLISIFAIGALMVMSGLTYRISLHILKRVPATPFWYNLSLFFYGLILTPVIPSQLGRTTIVLPFLSTLIDTAGGRKYNPAVSCFIVSTMAGVGLAASIFLTGKPANLIIFGLFDSQTQFAFAWLQWFYAASFTGLVLVLLYLLMVMVLSRNKEKRGIPKHVIDSQMRALGPITGIEWSALTAIVLLVAGIVTASRHRVDIAWLSMGILVALLLLGRIQKDDISKRVDWSVLIFIASIVAWVPIMRLTGIEQLVSGYFGWVGLYMKTQFPLFVLALCGVIVLIRFALPEMVTEILLVTVLLPLANAAGVSPWLIGFIILTMCEAYIFPYQAPYHLQLKNQLALLHQDALYDEKSVIRSNIVLTLIRVLAINASLPFWKYLDIL